MLKRKSFQVAAILVGGALALPPVLLAAEKDNMMKDDKGKMVEETGGNMKENKAGAMKPDKGKMSKDNMKQEKGKAKTGTDKMKMNKMEDKRMYSSRLSESPRVVESDEIGLSSQRPSPVASRFFADGRPSLLVNHQKTHDDVSEVRESFGSSGTHEEVHQIQLRGNCYDRQSISAVSSHAG